jgi:hypothetical protein
VSTDHSLEYLAEQTGGTTIGNPATIAGQAAISDHPTIGNPVIVGPKPGMGKSIADGEVVSGSTPSMPIGNGCGLSASSLIFPISKRKYRCWRMRLLNCEKPSMIVKRSGVQ